MARGLLIADLSLSYISLAELCAQFGRSDFAEAAMKRAREFLTSFLKKIN